MGGYLVKRLLLLIPMAVGITLITFFIVRLAGASTEESDNGDQGRSTERGGTLREKLMIDQFGEPDASFFSQYTRWLKRTAQGNLGKSLNDGQPVSRKILQALPVTLTFNLISILAIYLCAVPIGMYSATHAGSKLDHVSSFGLYALFSLPSFWVAILLIRYVGSAESGLGWLPYSGLHPDGWRTMTTLQYFWHAIPYMILPLTCMIYPNLAGLSRYTRSGMIEVVRQDYIRTARAKGLSETAVILGHAFRNSLIPLVTLLGGTLPAMIGGSVIIESIFSIPGLGRMGWEAVLQHDYTVLMAVTTLSAFLTMIGFLLSDLLYAAVDPRIGFAGDDHR